MHTNKEVVASNLLATSLLLSSTLVTLLGDGESDTTATGHRDHGLFSAEDENVAETGGEITAKNIADVDNVKATEVTLLAGNDTGTALVTTTSDHDGGTSVKGDKVEDLLRLNVESDSVVNLDGRVGVSDGAAVVGDNVGDTTGTELHLLDLEELVRGLLGGDAVDDESALNVVEDAEVLARLFDRDNVLETGGVGGVGADLAVDLDESLGSDGVDLTAGEGVLQSVAEENLFVGKRRWGQQIVVKPCVKCKRAALLETMEHHKIVERGGRPPRSFVSKNAKKVPDAVSRKPILVLFRPAMGNVR